ncbi:MAG: HAD family phosphatase, partial [Candidatus Obscuribacterales bacterium]|nr:HAD family phosphatase [Candidatus Obscuribacterales bacterium]
MSKEPIELIAFDMGHVLIDFEWDSVCEQFQQAAGKSREEFLPILSKVGKLGYEIGQVTTAEFLATLNQLLDIHLSESEFTPMWNFSFRENQSMAGLLERVRLRYRLYLLSNTNQNHYQYIQDNFNVERHFEELILSYMVRSAKPNLAIYEEVMLRSGLNPGQCLFIDDLKENIETARALGMKSILFDGHERLFEKLTEYG